MEIELGSLLEYIQRFGKSESAARVSLSRMVKSNILINKNKKDQVFYQLTREGLYNINIWNRGVERFFKRYELRNKTWDNKWTTITMINFKKSGEENQFVIENLLELGYKEIDNNVWLSPYYLEDEIKNFQRASALSADGIIGPKTFYALRPYLLGYVRYEIQPRDNFYSIARKFNTHVALIAAANPDVDPARLQISQTIIVPLKYNVVDTNIACSYEMLEHDIEGLLIRYPFLEVGSAGRSVLGKKLYTIRLGTGPNQILYCAAHHALEWITSPLLLKFVEEFSKAYAMDQYIMEYNPANIWLESSVYIIPMVNPDGVDLVLDGLQPGNPYADELLSWNGGSRDFSSDWQANIRGVDLSHNYDAAFSEYKYFAERMGITSPAPAGFPGSFALSEPESHAVADFAKNHDFNLILDYHAQGEIIFWNFKGMATQKDRQIGEYLACLSGYDLIEATAPETLAGLRDWFIKSYKRPAYTFEVGKGKNPLPIGDLPDIFDHNIRVLLEAPRLV